MLTFQLLYIKVNFIYQVKLQINGKRNVTTPEWSHFRKLIFMSPRGPSTLERLLDCSEQVFDAVVHNIMLIGTY